MGRPLKVKASFVIPVYNGQAYLAETLVSCLNQTERGIEVVVVDDGSSDHTADIIRYFAATDKRVKPLFLPENVGRSEARNKGIEAATSDMLLMLDADDIATPRRVIDTLGYARTHPNESVFYGKFQAMDMLGNATHILDAPAFDFERLKKTGFAYIGHSTMAFRRSVFEKVRYTGGGYSANGIDDWKFQVDAHKAGFKFGAIPKILGHYRVIPKARDEAKVAELKKACLS